MRCIGLSLAIIVIRTLARTIRSALPVPMRRSISSYLSNGLEREFPSIESALQTLAALGFRPSFCVDVGAYHGDWTNLCRSVFPDARVMMVEAQEAKKPILEEVVNRSRGLVQVEVALLGAEEGRSVDFTQMETGSSVFEEDSQCPRSKSIRTTRTLDGLLAAAESPQVDLLKLDVQGYELEVLRGARRVLTQATAVLAEASLVPINSGCPLLAEVVSFMNEAGFRPFDFCSQIRRKDGVLWQTDLLFLKSSSPFLPTPKLTPENW